MHHSFIHSFMKVNKWLQNLNFWMKYPFNHLPSLSIHLIYYPFSIKCLLLMQLKWLILETETDTPLINAKSIDKRDIDFQRIFILLYIYIYIFFFFFFTLFYISIRHCRSDRKWSGREREGLGNVLEPDLNLGRRLRNCAILYVGVLFTRLLVPITILYSLKTAVFICHNYEPFYSKFLSVLITEYKKLTQGLDWLMGELIAKLRFLGELFL